MMFELKLDHKVGAPIASCDLTRVPSTLPGDEVESDDSNENECKCGFLALFHENYLVPNVLVISLTGSQRTFTRSCERS